MENGGTPTKECRVLPLNWHVVIPVEVVAKTKLGPCNFFEIFTTKLRR